MTADGWVFIVGGLKLAGIWSLLPVQEVYERSTGRDQRLQSLLLANQHQRQAFQFATCEAAGNLKNVLHLQLDRSSILGDQLTWSPCSLEDGLSWTLKHRATSYDLHAHGALKAPQSVNLAQQCAKLDASFKDTVPANTPQQAPVEGFLLHPNPRVKTTKNPALNARSSTKSSTKQAVDSSDPVQSPKRNILWCSFNAIVQCYAWTPGLCVQS